MKLHMNLFRIRKGGPSETINNSQPTKPGPDMFRTLGAGTLCGISYLCHLEDEMTCVPIIELNCPGQMGCIVDRDSRLCSS